MAKDGSAKRVDPALPASARGSQQSTRERILEASRLRFNEEGLHAVPVYRVAAGLGISQGNLTYHFKTKADIALELADAFEAELNAAAKAQFEAAGADKVLFLLEGTLRVLWRYRFLLASPNYLASLDPRLEKRYQQVHRNVRLLIRSTTGKLVDAGVMRAPRSSAADIIADNIVAVWMAWLQLHGFSEDSHRDVPTRAMLLDCFEHHFGLLEPYVSSAFVTELDKALGAYRAKVSAPGETAA